MKISYIVLIFNILYNNINNNNISWIFNYEILINFGKSLVPPVKLLKYMLFFHVSHTNNTKSYKVNFKKIYIYVISNQNRISCSSRQTTWYFEADAKTFYNLEDKDIVSKRAVSFFCNEKRKMFRKMETVHLPVVKNTYFILSIVTHWLKLVLL